MKPQKPKVGVLGNQGRLLPNGQRFTSSVSSTSPRLAPRYPGHRRGLCRINPQDSDSCVSHYVPTSKLFMNALIPQRPRVRDQLSGGNAKAKNKGSNSSWEGKSRNAPRKDHLYGRRRWLEPHRVLTMSLLNTWTSDLSRTGSLRFSTRH